MKKLWGIALIIVACLTCCTCAQSNQTQVDKCKYSASIADQVAFSKAGDDRILYQITSCNVEKIDGGECLVLNMKLSVQDESGASAKPSDIAKDLICWNNDKKVVCNPMPNDQAKTNYTQIIKGGSLEFQMYMKIIEAGTITIKHDYTIDVADNFGNIFAESKSDEIAVIKIEES